MIQLTPELEAIGRELRHAYSTRLRRRRRLRLGSATVCCVLLFAGAAYASGVADDLGLDPTKWEILEGGSVDGGKAAFVRAKSLANGTQSTFMVEHDAGMDRYDAFLLHERTLDAAGGSPESGPLCTRTELARIEQETLDALRANTAPDPSDTCRGREYGIEIARAVYAGIEPGANLMPGVG
jgi:hypothetical protein